MISYRRNKETNRRGRGKRGRNREGGREKEGETERRREGREIREEEMITLISKGNIIEWRSL